MKPAMRISREGLAYCTVEQGDHPWCVLTHGAFMSQGTFAALIPTLAPHFRLLLWDLPGHGESARVDPPMRMSGFAGHLNNLLDELGIEEPWLIGHSFGGMVSQQFVRDYPIRAKALIAYGCVALHLTKMPLPGLLAWLSDLQIRFGNPQALAKIFVEQCSTRPEVQQTLLASVTAQTLALRKPLWHSMIYSARWQHDYRFPCPVAQISGVQDTRFPGAEKAMDQFAANIAPAPHERVPNTGHCPHIEEPAAFATALLRLVTDLKASFVPPLSIPTPSHHP